MLLSPACMCEGTSHAWFLLEVRRCPYQWESHEFTELLRRALTVCVVMCWQVSIFAMAAAAVVEVVRLRQARPPSWRLHPALCVHCALSSHPRYCAMCCAHSGVTWQEQLRLKRSSCASHCLFHGCFCKPVGVTVCAAGQFMPSTWKRANSNAHQPSVLGCQGSCSLGVSRRMR